MSIVFSTVLPITAVLVLGAVLRRSTLKRPDVWRGIEWLSYFVFTPALFVSSIGKTDLGSLDALLMLASLAIPLVSATAVVIALRRPLRLRGPAVTSIVQRSVRINTYIGLAFAAAPHGTAGVASFAIASAVVVPLVNVLCVSTLARYGYLAAARPRSRLVRELASNPLILACAAGVALSLTGTGVPDAVAPLLNLFSSPALVAGTLAAGAAIRFDARWRDLLDISLASALKLVAVPWAAASIAIAMGISGTSLVAIVLISAVPTAPSATVLAARMGVIQD
ncbi:MULTISPECIES: AEC family transporter [unclassified Microbacterium]|uniref:AEC family transporter n=1 Tax=unclassified Microbacterium TaxID=2609290 RepID=UPI0018D5C812|nr:MULTISPECIES: hypothetical protein [unclassified Microbacterium]